MFLQEHPDYHQRESEYFTQIKTNPALQKLLYHTSTGSVGEDMGIIARAAGEDFASNLDSSDEFIQKAGKSANKYGGLGALWEGLKQVGRAVEGPLQYIARHAVDPVMALVSANNPIVGAIIGTGNAPELARDEYVRKYIASGNATDDDLYKL